MRKGRMRGRLGFVYIVLLCAAIVFVINLLHTVSLLPSGERAQGTYSERTPAEQSELDERLHIAREEAGKAADEALQAVEGKATPQNGRRGTTLSQP